MVAKITTPSTITRALNYNEKKVQKAVASCLYAGNFLKDASDMNFYEKLARFQNLTALNTRAKTASLHISLNFHPSEALNGEKLVQIATSYMDKIGFGQQPYLVYEHRDAGHPHLHIVTTSIREDGSRIITQNIGKNASQKARKEIEEAFGLMRASSVKSQGLQAPGEDLVQKIRYGKTDSKRSISNVLNKVVHHYHFTSLPELNAVLKLYNLKADRGAEDSRTYRNSGLTYRILDESWHPIGVPIKASSIHFKPTLKYLGARFKEGEEARTPHKQKIKTAIDFVLHKRPRDLSAFAALLKEEKVSTDLRTNAQGFVYGITFIDHRTGCVFNGSDLGKGYSAAGLQQRMATGQVESENRGNLLQKRRPEKTLLMQNENSLKGESTASDQLLNDLLKMEREDKRIPYELRKKKKKNRGLNL
ncbi:MAG: relaxase [Chitinophagaceae bacterium]|nr:MAG: relaxase [Chitinophagaceae bacterium]